MTQGVVRLSAASCAFLDTARSRRRAVEVFRILHCMSDGSEIPNEVAVQVVEAYYAQNGGKPWLRKKAAS